MTKDDPGPADVPPVSLAGIKTLSLSCRLFANVGPKYLFEHLWLLMDEDSLAKLSALSTHSKYENITQTIDFFPTSLPGTLLIKAEYKGCIKGIIFNTARGEVWKFNAEGNCTLSQEYLDSGFAEYVGTYDKQLDFRTKSGNVLQAALPASICMEYLSTGFAAEAFFSGQPPRQLSRIGKVAQRTLLVQPCQGLQGSSNEEDHPSIPRPERD